jgi:hypothetical protein
LDILDLPLTRKVRDLDELWQDSNPVVPDKWGTNAKKEKLTILHRLK